MWWSGCWWSIISHPRSALLLIILQLVGRLVPSAHFVLSGNLEISINLKLFLWSFPLIPPAHFVSLGNNLHFHNCGTDLLSSQLGELWLWKFNLIFRNPAFRFPPPLINFAPLKWKLSKGENAIDGVHRNVGNLAGQENAKMQPMDCIEILWNCPIPFLHWSHPLLFINKSTL